MADETITIVCNVKDGLYIIDDIKEPFITITINKKDLNK